MNNCTAQALHMYISLLYQIQPVHHLSASSKVPGALESFTLSMIVKQVKFLVHFCVEKQICEVFDTQSQKIQL